MYIEDLLYKGLNYYQRVPAFISGPLGKLYRSIPLNVRFGGLYSEYNRLIENSEKWDSAKISEYTISQLKLTFINAYENSLYFRQLFQVADFNPYNFKSIDDLIKVPFSDKENLRKSKNEILCKNYSKSDLLYVTTGGTSGIPVEVYFVKGRERTREFVFMTDQWRRAGYTNTDRIARIRGTVVDYKGNNTYFRFEPIKNRLYLSSYDLYEMNFPLYIDKLEEFKPHFIHTYPSAITSLAKYLKSEDKKISGLKGLLCSSEQFYPGQRELIEEAFGVKVFSWYGHTESTTLAGECECSNHYHVYFQYGYTELIDQEGKPIEKPGVRGEITGTSYEMRAFPIIRYRTGDFGEWVEGNCKCGRNYRLITNVIGRWEQEQIITKIDSKISLTALNMHNDIFDNVQQYQFYQKEKGKVVLRIIRMRSYTKADEVKILKGFKEKFKDLVDFEIEYVEIIYRTTRGKQKFLISELE